MGNIKRNKHGPEWYIQRDLKTFLRDRGWLVEQTHGNLYQKGFPDLYIKHPNWKLAKWIDCKAPQKYCFTREQKMKWPVWDAYGIGIWIITAATQVEYDKLFGPPNWRDYWKPSYGLIPGPEEIEALMAEMDKEANEATD